MSYRPVFRAFKELQGFREQPESKVSKVKRVFRVLPEFKAFKAKLEFKEL